MLALDFFFILLDMELILLHFIPRAELNMGFGDIDILKKEKQDNALQIEHLNTLSYSISGKILKNDPVLALTCFFGPCTPLQYRLMGPNSWRGAKKAILTQWERVEYPLQTRYVEPDQTDWKSHIMLAIFMIVIAWMIKYILGL